MGRKCLSSLPGIGRYVTEMPGGHYVTAARGTRLLDQLRDTLLRHHFSFHTEKAYISWVRRYVLLHGKRHLREYGASDGTAFLTHLAVNRNASVSAHNQAPSAIPFLYQKVLETDLPWLQDAVRAKRSKRVPNVLRRGGLAGRSPLDR